MERTKTTVAALMAAARERLWPHERGADPKRQTIFCYQDGPMFWLGQKIVLEMQKAGYPAKIAECYRDYRRQMDLLRQGRSKAMAFQSPHQFYLAVDIIHPSKGWDVSSAYWETLASCVRVVEEKYGRGERLLVHGHNWQFKDSAHVQLANWHEFADRILGDLTPQDAYSYIVASPESARMADIPSIRAARFVPTSDQLAEWFREVLPQVWEERFGKPKEVQKTDENRAYFDLVEWLRGQRKAR